MLNPIVSLSAGTPPTEGGVTGTYRIKLNTPAPVGGLTINFNTTGSTATLNNDYNFALGANLTAVTANSFTIAEGATTATLNLVAHADTLIDPDETVLVNLTAGTDYQLATGTFSPKADYAAGSGSYSISTGDFNNDGHLDLAVTNPNSNTVSVLMGNATGFDTKIDYATGLSPVSVSTGDFNGDGKLDLAVANASSNTVSVLLRNATNTGFDANVDYATGANPFSVSVGDFNRDGKLDLAVANLSSNTVSVLLGNATGFDANVDYATSSNPLSVSVGDFNNDGKLDLAVANYTSSTVSVLLANATGFDDRVDYATGLNPRFVNVGDFNNDGKLDLAVANSSNDTVSVLLANATGFDAKIDYATGFNPASVNVGDFNNDSKLDLAVTNYGSDTVSVLFGNATGFDTKVDYATGLFPNSVSVGDFNNDGKLDLAVANNGGNNASVLLNDANPTATLIIAEAPLNTAPIAVNDTLTAIEDTVIIYTDTQLLSNDNPSNKTVLSSDSKPLVIASVSSGANGTAVLSADGKTVTFTPNVNFNGVADFTYQASDGTLTSNSATVTVNVDAVNDAPTLTAFSLPVSTGNENHEITVSFADLQTQGNEADVDGSVDAFVIKAVSTGTLKIGVNAATATQWNALSNHTIDATHQAYWTPAANTNGTLNAFTAVAKDNDNLESVTPVQATVNVAAMVTVPPHVTISAGTNPVEGSTVGNFNVTLDSPAPAGGLTVNYTLTGLATLSTDYTVTA
ncbi:MAG: FG-GAP-like repeat-containing protein, partial [Methylococcaceae bacterium]|nr:FG-GAP-like repeat-containing protein [Methylococcaceae bacterium]